MVQVRPAYPDDDASVQDLLGQLGYDHTAAEVRARLGLLAATGSDPILLATEHGSALGLIALHYAAMLHHRDRVARVTALVVRAEARGQGIGRVLIEAGAALARQADCSLVELTTALHRTGAQAFYRSLGFTASSLRFQRATGGL